jgi:hypothetical protein
MKNIKLGHALSFFMHIKKNSLKKIKKKLGISKAIRVFEDPPYYVFDNLSVRSIYSEVLGLLNMYEILTSKNTSKYINSIGYVLFSLNHMCVHSCVEIFNAIR